ncbi:Trifunctional enzyme subunit alpha, mitochondrial [Thelohanellus kitauei]|uniref:3-hydroxyisobutyryl-CoA hydrolase n=1 Tax=Thelohanellus kitauei TaxID=669202 RepID=A0A0C2MKC6_THEKT|nr:Trifunctional enzyme subunit alpha, mitochondrial [Thelohanellus kitauei]
MDFDMCSKLFAALEQLNKDPNVKIIALRSSKHKSFFAGADLHFLNQLNTETVAFSLIKSYDVCTYFQNLIKYILVESLNIQVSKPTVAIVEGDCLGGGLELALATSYTVALGTGHKFGFPETMIGLIPGGLGTFMAMNRKHSFKLTNMILSGEIIGTQKAYEHLILTNLLNVNERSIWRDDIEVILNLAEIYANEKEISFPPDRWTETFQLKTQPRNTKDEGKLQKYRGLAFSKMRSSAFLVRKFLINYAVIGSSGYIGGQLAQLAHDQSPSKLLLIDPAYNDNSYPLFTAKKQLKIRNAKDNRYSYVKNLEVATNEKHIECADVIFEAVPENLELKRSVLGAIDKIVKKDCIVATCTSGITLEELTSGFENPQNFIGLHFFSPVNKMKLVEIVPSVHTSPEILSKSISLLKGMKKTAIIVKDSPGFYTTRVLASMIAEAFELYEKGVDPYNLDRELKAFGFNYSLSESIDQIGLDTCQTVYDYLCSKLGDKFTNIRSIELLKYLLSKDCLGAKNGEGISLYDSNRRSSSIQIPGFFFHRYIRVKIEYSLEPYEIDEVQPRLILRMLNECCKCLEEGVITSPMDGDIGAVYGFGFPSMLMGPFAYIDQFTPQNLVASLNKFYEYTENTAFQPCQLLLDMAKDDRRFYPA